MLGGIADGIGEGFGGEETDELLGAIHVAREGREYLPAVPVNLPRRVRT